jgi:hypothetical protein
LDGKPRSGKVIQYGTDGKDDRTRPRQYLRAGVLVAEVLAC